MSEEKILNIILENVKEFRQEVREDFKNIKDEMSLKFNDIEKKIAKIEEEMIKKNECSEIRSNCYKPQELEVLKNEWSYKKIMAIGGVITASLTAATTAIISIWKLIYG